MNIKDVENLAELARINLKEDEKQSILKDFENILAYVDMIKNIELDSVEEKPNMHNIWREDDMEVKDFDRELITSQFPDFQNGFLKVKKIL